MKVINRSYMAGILMLSVILAGCGDSFFDHTPQGQIVQGNFYNTAKELQQATGAMYNVGWFDFNDKAKIEIGDGAGGTFHTWDDERQRFVEFRVDSDHVRMTEMWRSLYIIINQANTHIANIQESASANIDKVVIDHRIAEARFMRAVGYYYLLRLWEDVPIITNTSDLITNPFVHRNRKADVFHFVLNELEHAAQYLVLDDEAGRVTKWSAKAYLAKVHLDMAYHNSGGGGLVQSHLDAARQYSEDVILNSPHRLMNNYADLFKRVNNNNSESIFALQWVVGSGEWGASSSTQAYYAAEPGLTGVGDGWGGGTHVSTWAWELFGGTSTADARRKATYMVRGDYYPELRTAFGGYTNNRNDAAFKKYVVGRPEDNDGQVQFMMTDMNTYMMRLAEVYLIHAEAILGNNATTSDGQALESFNRVRTRAGVEPLSSITYIDILEERVREFTLEGVVWYDLVRLFHWRPNEIMAYMNQQERDSWAEYSGEAEDYVVYTGRPVSVEPRHFRMPYPEIEISGNPNFMDEPVPYDFN